MEQRRGRPGLTHSPLSCHSHGQSKIKTSEAICQQSLKRPSQMYHWANLKLRKATVPANIALHLLTPKHPPKVKYSLNPQIYSTITILVIPIHPPKEKYFQRQGQDQAVRKSFLTETLTTLRDHKLQRGAIRTNRTATVMYFLKHPPKVKYHNIQKIL